MPVVHQENRKSGFLFVYLCNEEGGFDLQLLLELTGTRAVPLKVVVRLAELERCDESIEDEEDRHAQNENPGEREAPTSLR